MFNTTTFESRLAIVREAVGSSTRKPAIPKDRAPRLHNKQTQTNQCLSIEWQVDAKAVKHDLAAHRLWKSMIHLLGNFLEKSPDASKFPRSELKNFIAQMEICLGVREGKLNVSEYGNLMIKFDELSPYVDGEKQSEDLLTVEKVIQAYGDKIASG